MIEQPGVQAAELVDLLTGQRITGVRRILYIFGDQVERRYGPVEVSLANGCFVFDCAGNGEDLRSEWGPWADPFAAPLSSENEEFVRTHGKWAAFDFGGVDPWGRLIGSRVVRVDVLPSRVSGRPARGASIVTDRGALRIEAVADELEAEVTID